MEFRNTFIVTIDELLDAAGIEDECREVKELELSKEVGFYADYFVVTGEADDDQDMGDLQSVYADGDVYLKSDVAPWINEGVHNACMTLFEKGDFEYEGRNDQPDCDKERMAYED